MAEYTFYTNPMSRGQIARWALHEAGADYEAVIVDWQDKPAAFLAANPMGKVPTVIHHAPYGDQVVTECAAICAYLADVFPEAGLGPREDEKADYYRWLFFAAGPLEQAVTNNFAGFNAKEDQKRMFGYGSYDLAVNTLADHLGSRDYVCGSRFTAADVYVGSAVLWGTQFGTLPKLDAFTAYGGRVAERDAYKRGKDEDNQLIAEIQAAG